MSKSLAKRAAAGGLQKYDPEKGVKKIAVMEMAEKHYAKAKDATELQRAIRGKLEAQAEFVEWWDTNGPGTNYGGNRTKGQKQDRRPDILAPQTVSRWRAKLKDPDKFEQTYTAVCAKYPKLLEFEQSAHVSHNSGDNEWYTPEPYIAAAREVMGGIDLDPASSETANTIVKAAQIFTAADDGLAQRWDGRIWLNPPYAQPLIEHFSHKLATEHARGHVSSAIVLVNNATDTQWFRVLADRAAAICFPTGRVRFWQPNSAMAAPLQGQAVLYLGEDARAFCVRFAVFGFVVTLVRE